MYFVHCVVYQVILVILLVLIVLVYLGNKSKTTGNIKFPLSENNTIHLQRKSITDVFKMHCKDQTITQD